MNFILNVIVSAFVCGYVLEVDGIPTNHSVQMGNTAFFQGPYDQSNIKLLHFQGKSYYLGITFKTSFLQASLFCQMIHMQLVSIHSAAESDRLYRYIMDTIGAGNNFWSSGSRLVDDKTWLWLSTGKKMKYTNWVSTQPDNSNNNERCIELAPENNGLYWNDLACEKSDYFICEKYDDLLHGSDDSNKPTDGGACQGINDQFLPQTSGVERKYRVAKVKATQGTASLTCKQYGIELVSIPNKETNDILTNVISQYDKTVNYWTSGIKHSNGKWIWWDHRTVAYTNWAPTEPNNLRNPEFCIQLQPNGKWSDVNCDNKLYFICETLNIATSSFCNPQLSVNIHIHNKQEIAANGSDTTFSCGEERNIAADGDDPFYAIEPRIRSN
ncbi:macrophage mannose receptor 1 [Anoplophora glabripennis]|uniref:macrophage mannose receptor 1 n=1 Tax=Anoplophora glabripennis TaxID=217634 RepID=UPI000875477D|nr:macrophage mannose receptor 1 [Anoplophora glabripennis]XP_018577175.1 macrophage mannose receptor 1 [Anoplophora glabripennis]XP_018577176.1 macrophage mannose receptor 1 [Anoplophora glabripennis]XP_018577177.1 macrophage mannose receptor 1 [Anoplophora glabripennis]